MFCSQKSETGSGLAETLGKPIVTTRNIFAKACNRNISCRPPNNLLVRVESYCNQAKVPGYRRVSCLEPNETRELPWRVSSSRTPREALISKRIRGGNLSGISQERMRNSETANGDDRRPSALNVSTKERAFMRNLQGRCGALWPNYSDIAAILSPSNASV